MVLISIPYGWCEGDLKSSKSAKHSLENDYDFCHPIKKEDNPHDNHDIAANFHNFSTVFFNPFHPSNKEG